MLLFFSLTPRMDQDAWARLSGSQVRRAARAVSLSAAHLDSLPADGRTAAFLLEGVQTPLLPQALLQALYFLPAAAVSYVEVLSKPLNSLGNLDLIHLLERVRIDMAPAVLAGLPVVPSEQATPFFLTPDNSALFELKVAHALPGPPATPPLSLLRAKLRDLRAGGARARSQALARLDRESLQVLQRTEAGRRAAGSVLAGLGLCEADLDGAATPPPVEDEEKELDLFNDEELRELEALWGVQEVSLGQLRPVPGYPEARVAAGGERQVLCRLLPGEEVWVRLWVTKGYASRDSRWQKGLLTPRKVSRVQTQPRALPAERALELWSVCPTNVFDLEDLGHGSASLVAARPLECVACRRCLLNPPGEEASPVSLETPAAASCDQWLVLVTSYTSQTPRELLQECKDFLADGAGPVPAVALGVSV